MDGYDRAIAWTKIAKSIRCPMDEDRDDDRDHDAIRSMRIQRSRKLHMAAGKHPIASTESGLPARVLIGDRVESGPRDRSRPR